MNKKILTLLLIAILFSVPASAEAADSDTPVSDLFSEMEPLVNDYNENLNSVPTSVKYVIGDKDILLLIDMNDESELAIKAVTNADMKVTTFEKLDAVEPGFDLTITAKEDVVRQLLVSENVVPDFNTAYNNGEIKIVAASTMNKVIISVGGAFLKLLSAAGFA